MGSTFSQACLRLPACGTSAFQTCWLLTLGCSFAWFLGRTLPWLPLSAQADILALQALFSLAQAALWKYQSFSQQTRPQTMKTGVN